MLSDIHVLPVQSFDHCPLFISCHDDERASSTKKRIFRYEASWSKKEDCSDIVKLAWRSSVNYTNKVDFVKRGLDRCKDHLVRWSKSTHGD